MKRSRIFLSLLCAGIFLTPSMLNAQGKSIGVKGGISFANYWGEGTTKLNDQIASAISDLDERNQIYFTVSVFSSKEILPDLLSIQSEILYSRGGKSWEGTLNGEKVTFGIQTDYLQMPWLAKLSFPVFLKPTIYAGPHISWMFRSRFNDAPSALDTLPIFQQVDVNGKVLTGDVNVIDLGLTTGLEISFPLSIGRIVVDGRYTLGGLDVFNFSQGSQIKNYSFLIMLGYALNFGGSY